MGQTLLEKRLRIEVGPWRNGAWIEDGDTMYGYGLLGTQSVIYLIVWIIKRMWRPRWRCLRR